MPNQNGRISLSSFFESQFGYSTKLRPEDVERLKEAVNSIPAEGGYLYINKIKDELRASRAAEKGIPVENTSAVYVEFAPATSGNNTKSSTRTATTVKTAAARGSSTGSNSAAKPGGFKEF